MIEPKGAKVDMDYTAYYKGKFVSDTALRTWLKNAAFIITCAIKFKKSSTEIPQIYHKGKLSVTIDNIKVSVMEH